jgi:metal-dependent amidase/aminoacylase/carboxypeptidase family protein
MLDNAPMVAAYVANAHELTGRTVSDPRALGTPVVGSTDMGNVSYLVPSIHPMIAVAPSDVAIHTAEFARHARGPSGDVGVVDGALAMAATVVDLWSEPTLLAAATGAHAADVDAAGGTSLVPGAPPTG